MNSSGSSTELEKAIEGAEGGNDCCLYLVGKIALISRVLSSRPEEDGSGS